MIDRLVIELDWGTRFHDGAFTEIALARIYKPEGKSWPKRRDKPLAVLAGHEATHESALEQVALWLAAGQPAMNGTKK